MTTDTTTPVPPTAPPNRLRRVVLYTGRLLLIGCLCWAAWAVLGSWSLLLHGDKTETPPAPTDPVDIAPLDLLAVLPPGSRWTLPAAALPGEKQPAADDLLPLGSDVRRVSEQRGAGGELLAQIVSFEGKWATLAASWRAAGWELQELRHHLEGDERLRCRRDGATVQVWAGPVGDDGGRVVFLVRDLAVKR